MASCLQNFMLVDQDLLGQWDLFRFFQFPAPKITKICLDNIKSR